MSDTPAEPELPILVELAALPRDGRFYKVVADAAACAAIAKRIGAKSISAFSGTITLRATKKKIFAEGSVQAVLLRECVSSLEEMTEVIEETFEVEFLRHPEPENVAADEEVIGPDVHPQAAFDVGDLAIQQVALAMDPFPRKPGVASLVGRYGHVEEASPFADLQVLIEKNKK